MTELEQTNSIISIAKLACMLLIGVIILSGTDAAINTGNIIATFNFDGNPTDGDTITIDNYVFEFDSGNGVGTGHVAVLIGATRVETVNNFANTVDANMDLVISYAA